MVLLHLTEYGSIALLLVASILVLVLVVGYCRRYSTVLSTSAAVGVTSTVLLARSLVPAVHVLLHRPCPSSVHYYTGTVVLFSNSRSTGSIPLQMHYRPRALVLYLYPINVRQCLDLPVLQSQRFLPYRYYQ